MRSLLLILISVSWLLALPAARAQLLNTADDFFNDGAHAYLTNNTPLALQSVEAGLKQYPQDEKLKKLYQLLKQQQQQQQQNQQQQNQQQQKDQQQKNQQNQRQKNNQNSQSSKDQKDQQQPKQDQKQDQDQKKPDQSGQKKDQPNDQPKDQQNQPSAADKQNGQKPEDKNGEEQKVGAGKMTPEEAKRLLDAQKDNEQVLMMKPNGKPPDTSHPIKDW
jgi:outer membrane biosynthesis protein TonB